MVSREKKSFPPRNGEIASGFGAVVIETDGGRGQKGKEAEGLVSTSSAARSHVLNLVPLPGGRAGVTFCVPLNN